jgi:hypothetical protein
MNTLSSACPRTMITPSVSRTASALRRIAGSRYLILSWSLLAAIAVALLLTLAYGIAYALYLELRGTSETERRALVQHIYWFNALSMLIVVGGQIVVD